MRKTTISDIMTTNVITAKPDTSFKRLAEVFAGQEIRTVPVIDQDRKIPLIAHEDVLIFTTPHTEIGAAANTRWAA